MLLTAILAGLHVLSAIAWMGGGILFGFIIAPGLAKLSPRSSGEFFAKIIPTVIRFFQIVPALTILFGILLLGNIANGDWSSISPTASSYGFDITFGITFAIIAFVLSEAVSAPALARVVRLIKGMMESGAEHPPAELQKAIRWASMSSFATFILLLLTLAFMVGAGFA